MAILTIIILSLLFGIFVFRDINKSVYLFIPFNYLYDLIYFSLDISNTIILNILRFIIIILFFYKMNKTSNNFSKTIKPSFKYYIGIMTILTISIILELFQIKSIVETSKFALIIYCFYAYFQYFSRFSIQDEMLRKMILYMSIITILNIIIANIFKLGWAGYSEDVGFYTGGIVSNMWYILGLIVLSSIALIYKKRQNLYFIITSLIILGILIIAFRRSAYIILGISGISALLFLKFKMQSIRVLIVFGVISIFVLPQFTELFEKQYDARTKTFEKGLEEETRLKESKEIWTERFEKSPLLILLFGEKPFITAENYGAGDFGDRPLHVDVNIVFFSTGLVGIILYFLFYVKILLTYNHIRKMLLRKNIQSRILNYIFFSTIISLIALSFSGGLNALTFRMFGFALLGISFGQLNKLKIKTLCQNLK